MAKLYDLARMTTATTGTGTITLGSAVSPFLTFANAGVANGDIVSYAIKDGANSEIGYGTYSSTGPTLTRTVRKSTNANAAISLSGTAEVFISPGVEDLLVQPITPGGRLTLASGTPVMTTTQSAKTTVYYTPYRGNYVPIYNGFSFEPWTFSELSQATTDATKSPGALSGSDIQDMFVWNDAGTLRCTRGPSWLSGAGGTLTARGTGAGSTELQMIQGIWTNKNAITNGPAANMGTYVGTIRGNSTSSIDFIYGLPGSGGQAAVLNVWNCYNRVLISTQVIDNGAPYNYTLSSLRQARGSSGNQISYIAGLAEDAFSAFYCAFSQTVGVLNAVCLSGIGVNTTSATSGGPVACLCTNAAATGVVLANANHQATTTLGVNTIYALERSDGSNANTFCGSGGTNALGFSFMM